jgi:hypothetical protein
VAIYREPIDPNRYGKHPNQHLPRVSRETDTILQLTAGLIAALLVPPLLFLLDLYDIIQGLTKCVSDFFRSKP